MIKASFGSGPDFLLSDKNLSTASRRRIVATTAALDLVAVAISKDKSEHKLAEEMKNFPDYVDAIYSALSDE